MMQTDVAILGGGLAGLTLAIQLRQRNPQIDVTVIERRAHPVREAAFKVGESTVEIGAHYFAEVLGFREHLENEQVRKYGLRYFFTEGSRQVDDCVELGVSKLLPTPSWQLDRGRFENFLGEQARALGVRFEDGSVVRSIDLGEDEQRHRIGYERNGETLEVTAPWVVDASGRAGLIKRKLGLAEANAHDANAVWWRLDGRLDPNDFSDDPDWLQRFSPADRWRSTNHMCGPGYWFWLIPLSSGSHSLGIVCDAKMHPLETMNTFEKAMAWLHKHQPRVAEVLEQSGFALQDFLFLRHFSHGCKQVFSSQRWALTGEAGLFLDPFYSPGSDFIAISNTYICDLIERDRAGEPIGMRADIYQQLYFSFYENTLSLYQDQYPIFGDPQVMPIKVIWDYAYYWALLAPLFCGGQQGNLAVLARLKAAFNRGRELNRAMQALLRAWGDRRPEDWPSVPEGLMLDQYALDWCREMNGALTDRVDDDAFVQRLQDNVVRMESLAVEILKRARAARTDLDTQAFAALLEGCAGKPDMLPAPWYVETERTTDLAAATP